ncbi:hypothetical protein HSB1_42390 [Halogranum salarium B-1]|uniref:Uncharacterized protein n=1 Tax=Halogranum salarium B-1 TaxID=1210908 RepID=J3JD89_9EURY|nr:hypothetical protein HSB1_42390 [Halogranum salarium B-1]
MVSPISKLSHCKLRFVSIDEESKDIIGSTESEYLRAITRLDT